MDDTTRRMTPRAGDTESELRTREIRDEIAQTRVDMSETIEAIQERLTPANLVTQAGESVRQATTEKVKQMANTASDTANRVMDTSFGQMVKTNPVPAAMIGIGAAWLLIKGRSDRARESKLRDYGRYRTDHGSETATRDWRVGNSPGAAIGTSGYSPYAADDRDESSRENYRELRRSYSGSGGSSVSFERVVRDNPLVVGAAAALVGVAIGMSLPASEAENRLMGETRDSVVGKARELASETAEKVQDVAGQAVDAVAPQRDAVTPTPDPARVKGTGPGRKPA